MNPPAAWIAVFSDAPWVGSKLNLGSNQASYIFRILGLFLWAPKVWTGYMFIDATEVVSIRGDVISPKLCTTKIGGKELCRECHQTVSPWVENPNCGSKNQRQNGRKSQWSSLSGYSSLVQKSFRNQLLYGFSKFSPIPCGSRRAYMSSWRCLGCVLAVMFKKLSFRVQKNYAGNSTCQTS